MDGNGHGTGHGAAVLDGGIETHLRALGESLRALRQERGHSLGAVALGTGLSASFLSMVENGRSDISTGRLHRVARFLGVRLGELLEMRARPAVRIVRAGERHAAEAAAGGLRMFPMVDRADDVAMTPVVTELEVGARAGAIPGAGGAERFALIVRGRVEITLAMGGVHTLATGDGAYFRSAVSEIRNAGGEPAVVLLVACAPSGRDGARLRARDGITQPFE